MKLKFIIAFVLVVAVGISSYFIFFNKSDEKKITETFENFESYYNSGDFDKCITCFNSKSQNMLKGYGTIGSAILGTDIGGIISGMFGLSVGSQDVKIKITIKSIDFTSDDTADVEYEIFYTSEKKNDQFTKNEKEKMVKEGNSWLMDETDELTLF